MVLYTLPKNDCSSSASSGDGFRSALSSRLSGASPRFSGAVTVRSLASLSAFSLRLCCRFSRLAWRCARASLNMRRTSAAASVLGHLPVRRLMTLRLSGSD
eukprot:CAMPEP_0168368394 /NCGR_PEP_ID=MMETSP0228-20121227/6228_1 /TAXON_ID=133427 /ORGANISM="Protoceratium reticulatum, Strain CCCM 535 (=CCMP 1889)" /LENGTH=100 /DNA_ID=CAMNT_0008381239 /DNA_START=102 /DNA_END=401 /DNA_ORIENTATION=+